MLGTKPFLAVLVLTALVSTSLSDTQRQEGTGFLSRLIAKGKGILSLSASALTRSKTASSRSFTLKNGTKVIATSVGVGRGGGGGGSWGWPEESSGWGGGSSGGWGNGGGGNSGGGGWGGGGGGGGGWGGMGGGGGWGGMGGGGGWSYSHTTKGKGYDMNSMIGGLALLGLAGLGAFALANRPAQSTTIMMMNMTGRRRRSADDFEDDEMLEGESLEEFLTRVGKYFNMNWAEENKTKNAEPFKLY
ncbi:unnamed protein product [Allacma fusca]|uniref:Glycine-rich protein n=1 Tax=Allacma fusca TaxID=39272 RepID=A0A8J2L1K2_9HEXA|nr:unnamed protein product [Allacma fusca]